jgi:hypothetical protein
MNIKNLKTKAVARDVFIIALLTFAAGFLTDVMMSGRERTPEYAGAMALWLLALQTFGFTILACLSHENRWKQLFAVVVVVGILGVMKVLFLDDRRLRTWLPTFLIVVLTAIVGGALSYTFKRERRPLHLPTSETSAIDNGRDEILMSFIVSILVAAIWPFIWPVLSWVTAFLTLAESPIAAVAELALLSGALYGESETASGFFKQMAHTAQQFSGDHPQLASLTYMAKVRLSFYVSIFYYIGAVLVFVLVTFVSLLSRILPGKLARNFVQRIAIGLALLPVAAESLWCIYFFSSLLFRLGKPKSYILFFLSQCFL